MPFYKRVMSIITKSNQMDLFVQPSLSSLKANPLSNNPKA